MIITVDFETYYDREFSLSKMTTEEYVRDDRFEVIGVGVKVDDAETEWFSGTYGETMHFLGKFKWDEAFVLAHNTMFDGAILSWKFGVKPMAWLDTLCMARATDGIEVGNSLAKLAERYNLGVKGNEVVNALGKRRTDFSADDLDRYRGYCIQDVNLTYRLFQQLAPRFNKTELKLIDLTLRMFTEPVLELNLPLLEQHLEEVKERKEKLMVAASSDKDTLLSNEKFAALLQSLGVEVPTKISPATGKEAWALAKSDEGLKLLAEHPDLRVQALVAARLGTKSTLEETRTERFIGIAKRGKMPVPLRYYAAHTGRWGGDDKLNLQNLPRSGRLKQAIVPPEGYVLVGADLSNIELRVGLWLAGQTDKLELLKNGLDLYKDFASSVFNVPYDEVTKDQRFIGKTSQLSLIYGTGANKLRQSIKTMSGTDIGDSTAKSIVDLYRTTYQNVKRIWNDGSKALEAVFSDVTYSFGASGFFTVYGKRGIQLPSGLFMVYNDLRREDTDTGFQWDYAVRYGRDKIYGAKVFQGLTQATARCIAAEHMLKLSRRYKVVLTVHDAVYLMVPEHEGPAAVEFVLETMRTPPKWMATIPLDAEAGYGKTLADC